MRDVIPDPFSASNADFRFPLEKALARLQGRWGFDPNLPLEVRIVCATALRRAASARPHQLTEAMSPFSLRSAYPRSVLLLLLLVAALVLGACGDESTAPAADDDPRAIEVTAPASVDEGEEFEVTVRVFGESASSPLTSFSGSVQLGVSAGSLAPTSVQVSAGVGRATVRITGASGEMTLTAALGALSASATVDVVASFRTLAGDPGDPVEGAIPELAYEPDPNDFAGGHPEVGDLRVSFRNVVVVFEPGATVGEANRILAPYEPEIVGGEPGVVESLAGILILRLNTATHEAMMAAVEALAAEPAVRHVVEDVLMEGLDPVEEGGSGAGGGGAGRVVSGGGADVAAGWTWELQPTGGNWGLELMRVPQMWNLYDGIVKRAFGGPGSELPHTGILDGGFQAHPDLTNLVTVPTGSFSVGDTDHGVHVAGTVGATRNNRVGVDGVNPLTHMHGHWYGSASTWWKSYFELVETHPQVRVVNLSLGYNWAKRTDAQGNPAPIDPATKPWARNQVRTAAIVVALRQLLWMAQGKAVPFVLSAAGNDSGNPLGDIEARWSSPFNYAALELGAANIVVVEAVRTDGGAPGGATRASFSNVGGHLSAPGTGILSTYASQPYAAIQGTSMATPHVTGVAGYLLAIEPSLTHPQLRDLLVANAQAVGGGAAVRVDAFASAMDIDRLTGRPDVLRMLVDIDDGTEDGNRRTDPDAGGADYTETDADGDSGPGDGRVDMSDFRRWRDAYLAVARPDGLVLDGSPPHPKKDANGNGKTPAEGDDEGVYPLADLNGDGKVDLVTPEFVRGRLNRNATDLEVLRELFADSHYEAGDLAGLVLSADVAVRPAKLLGADNVVEIRSSIRKAGTEQPEGGSRFNRVHTGENGAGEGLWQVYTVPVADEGYTVRVVAVDAAGDTLHDVEKDFDAKPGQDSFWDPEEEPFEYTEDFEEAIGPEWSSTTIEVSPSGARFLGRFNTDEVHLTLDDLPAHEEVIVELDLHVIGDWNGNEGQGDLLAIHFDGQVRLTTTFSNESDDPQAYPGGHPGSSMPAGTGAQAFGALGYPPIPEIEWADTTYRLTLSLPHTADSIIITILGDPSEDDETWGIDNVRVTTSSGGQGAAASK